MLPGCVPAAATLGRLCAALAGMAEVCAGFGSDLGAEEESTTRLLCTTWPAHRQIDHYFVRQGSLC
jgi:hypothetical protein